MGTLTLGSTAQYTDAVALQQARVPNISITDAMEGLQEIGTAHELIDYTGDCIYIVNIDTVNYVDIGIVVSAVFYPIARLYPGRPLPLETISGTVLYAKANTAAVNIKKFYGTKPV